MNTQKRRSRILSIILTLCLVIGLFAAAPMAASAADEYTGQIMITSGTTNSTVATSGSGDSGTAVWAKSGAGGTLTLTDFSLVTSDNYGIVFDNTVTGAVEIVLYGTNAVTGDEVGIFAEGASSLTISGSGALNVTGDSMSGIEAYNITISSGTVTATGGIIGILADNNITISGGAVTGTGGSSGIVVGNNITISGGTVTGTGGWYGIDAGGITTSGSGNAASFSGGNVKIYGAVTLTDDLTIESGKSLTVPSGSTLTIPIGKTLTNNGGTVYCSGTIYDENTGVAWAGLTVPYIPGLRLTSASTSGTGYTWDGSTLTLTDFSLTTPDDHAILFDDTVSGAVNIVLVSTNTVTGAKFGISAEYPSSSLTISGSGALTATSGWYGISANDNDVTIISGTVTAAGGSSEGIYTYGNLTITGGTVTATTTGEYGIYTDGDITISGGTVTVTGGDYGIRAAGGDITISGGTVTATGSYAAFGWSGTITPPDEYTYWTNTSVGDPGGAGTTYPGGAPFAPTSSGDYQYVRIEAQDALPPTYALTVGSGTGGGSYAVTTVVPISADAAPSGQVFDKWVLTSGGGSFADANSASTTFTMPARAATVTATYKPSPTIKVTKVTITNSTDKYTYKEAAKTRTVQHAVSIEPANATVKDVTWQSGDTTIATVNKVGLVTFTGKEGTARITAASADGPSHFKDIKVVRNVTKIRTPLATVNITKGKTLALPVELDDGSVSVTKAAGATFKSSNTKVATVDKTGKIKGIKQGTAKITVTSASGKSLTVKVNVDAKAVKLKTFTLTGVKKNALTLGTGKTSDLKIKLTQGKASDLKVTFGSSKNSVAKVDAAGRITALKKGTATITVKAGGQTVKVKVTVK